MPHLLDRACRQRHAGGAFGLNLFHLKVEATWLRRVEATLLASGAGVRRKIRTCSTSSARTSPAAQRAEQIWAERLAKDPKDFESAWKLARARYWLGTHAPERSRKAYLESGIAAGRAAIAAAPNKPEGHFWIAANMGALAESFGLRQGLKYRGDIKDALETVLRLDPAFQQGSADRALGRWYSRCRGCSAEATRSRRNTCASR